jgi:outer membrane protein TolC
VLRLVPLLLLPLVGSARAAELTLDGAVTLALTRNERAQIAARLVDAAEARVQRARAFFFPELSVSGTYTRRPATSSFREKNALDSAATLSMTLFDARAIPLYRAAKREQEAAVAGALEERRRLSFEAGEAFLVTLGAEQVAIAAERRRDLAKLSRDDAEARFKAGLVRSNDLTRTELELATAERELTRARNDRDTARLNLGYLLGAKVDGALAEPLAGLLTEPTDQASPERRRADVVQARKRYEAQRELAKEPRMRLIPTLSLFGQAGVSNETAITGRDLDWSIGVTLGWILFDGGERYADAHEQDALAEIARLRTVALERQVGVEVEVASVALGDRRAGVEQATVAVAVARKNAAEAQALYKQGLATALELSDANLSLFAAEVGLVRERYALAIAVLDLRAALGLDALGRDKT